MRDDQTWWCGLKLSQNFRSWLEGDPNLPICWFASSVTKLSRWYEKGLSCQVWDGSAVIQTGMSLGRSFYSRLISDLWFTVEPHLKSPWQSAWGIFLAIQAVVIQPVNMRWCPAVVIVTCAWGCTRDTVSHVYYYNRNHIHQVWGGCSHNPNRWGSNTPHAQMQSDHFRTRCIYPNIKFPGGSEAKVTVAPRVDMAPRPVRTS